MLSEQLQAFKQAVIKHTQAKEELSVSLNKRIALVPLFIYLFFLSYTNPPCSLSSFLECGWEEEALSESCRVLFKPF